MATRVVYVVVGLLALSVVMIAVAATGHRAATRAQADLDRTTRFDLLTGLPNRAQLESELDTAVADGHGRGHGGLILVELSRYAGINDTYGHEVGDGLLVAAAITVACMDRPKTTDDPVPSVVFGLSMHATVMAAATSRPSPTS